VLKATVLKVRMTNHKIHEEVSRNLLHIS
jgi:hypothetical protein